MTGGNSLSRASGSVPLASLKRSMTSVDNSDEEDVNVLPENLENMKTGFLQYRRMQLKSQVVSGDPKDKGGLEQELAEVERLEAERKQVRDELEQKKKALEEREKQYFADGVALANGFLEVARNVHELGKGALGDVFRDLQSEYAKALGLDDGSSSDDEVKPVRTTPTKMEKLAGVRPGLRLERS